VGKRALSDSFLIRRGGDCSSWETAALLFVSAAIVPVIVLLLELSLSVVLTLFAGGELGGEVTESVVMLWKEPESLGRF